jgi:hypothetical protein
MTGPEHYQQAELSLVQAVELEAGSDAERYFLADAQVHATLALAAATALAPASDVGTGADWTAWFEAASEAETGGQP